MKKTALYAGALALWMLFMGAGCAFAVEISEICPANDSVYRDGNGEYPDWIELYNPGSESVDLSDVWISDDEEEPRLFCLAGYVIGPEAYLVLAADDVTLPFKLSASGCSVYLTQSGSETVGVSVPPLSKDQTFSRLPDGAYGITKATPGAENAAGETYAPPVYVAPPRFSRDAGFYDEPFPLTLDSSEGLKIYYTLDGSVPTAESAPYEGPIFVDDASYHRNTNSMRTDIVTSAIEPPKTLLPKCAVVRAVSVDADGNVSAPVSNAYFVGFQNRPSFSGIAVMSVIVDPQDMFGENDGIYVLGKRYADWVASDTYDPTTPFYAMPLNFRLRGRENEILSAVQLFGADRSLLFSQKLGLRINGNISRQLPKKSIKLFARKEYGGGKTIDYRFWQDGYKAEKIAVKSAKENGAIAHAVLSERLPMTAKCLPCVLFIDGEYWGLYRVWESQDEQYIAHYCGVDEDEVVLIKNGALSAGEKADNALYTAMCAEVKTLVCAREADYARMDSLIDIDNYTDYLVGELYLNNGDWISNGNNISLWRTRNVGSGPYADGRWRWFYQDMDVTCYATEGLSASLLKESIFSALWTNEDYRTKFLTRVMDFANIDCAMPRVNALLDEYADAYRPYFGDSYERYNETFTAEGFESGVDGVRVFFENRRDQLARELTQTLRLDREIYTLTVRTDGARDAAVTLNDHAIAFADNEWVGSYFERCPLALRAGELPGYRFVGWFEDGRLLCADALLELEVNENRAILAQYEAKDTIFAADAENEPMTRDGELLLCTPYGQYGARFTVDPRLNAALGESGAIRLTARDKWEKDAYFEIAFNASGYGDMRFTLQIAQTGETCQRWALEYSADGAQYRELDEIRLEEGENAFAFTLPDALNDQKTAYLRFAAEKKSASRDGALTIEAAALYGVKADVTLARLRDCVALCAEKLGDAFEPPNLDALSGASQRDVDAMTDDLYARLASALVAEGTETVARSGIRADKLEGMDEYLCVTVAPEVAEIVTQVAVDLDAARYPETAYVYRWTDDGALVFDMTLPVTDGGIALDAEAGTYILLDRAAAALRCEVDVRADGLDADSLSHMLYGVVPDAYARITVKRNTAYQEMMTVELPDALTQDASGVWLYAVTGGVLSSETYLTIDAANGAAETLPLADGEYLALPMSLGDYRQEAETQARRAETAKAYVYVEKDPGKYLVYAAIAGCALLAAAVVGVALLRRRRRSRR